MKPVFISVDSIMILSEDTKLNTEKKIMEYRISYEHAVSNRGNLERMKKLMQRAAAGETLTIGFLGGSITQGSLASTAKLCYAYLVYEWWCSDFPKAHFTYLNAGIGATDSQFGCARVREDLLSGHPDFIIVEFSVNDEPNEHYMETYEGLIRCILSDGKKPALLLVHNVFYDSGKNAQLYHSRIGRYYDLPSVSMQSTIYPEVLSGRIPNRDITPDDLHPNDAGHELVASVITSYLAQISRQKMDPEEPEQILPPPLTQNGYENSVRYRNMDLNCETVSHGFQADRTEQVEITDIFRNGWTAVSQGDSIHFVITASSIAVQYRKTIAHPAPVAELILDQDERHPFILDANFDETWGDKLQMDTILDHGENCMHTIEIKISKTHENDQKPFYLVSVIGS